MGTFLNLALRNVSTQPLLNLMAFLNQADNDEAKLMHTELANAYQVHQAVPSHCGLHIPP